MEQPLTTLEFSALRLAADGGTATSIGRHLAMTPHEVASVLRDVRAKLRVPSTAAAVAAARSLPGWA